MRMKVTLVLAAAILLGAAPDTPTTPKAQESAVTPEDATITISPGTKYSIHPVKTEQGKRIRLKMPGATIEAVRLCVKSEGKIYHIEIGGRDGSMILQAFPSGQEGRNGGPAQSAAQAEGQEGVFCEPAKPAQPRE